MRVLTITLAIIFVAMPLNSAALVLGGSNLNILGYPSHSCYKPTAPLKPYSYDKLSVRSYNDQINIYNQELELYINCIENYLENANYDIKRIQEKAQEAIDEAGR